MLSLQFLDYPLLSLQPKQTGSDVLTVQAGKACQLTTEDAQEAAYLSQHVRKLEISWYRRLYLRDCIVCTASTSSAVQCITHLTPHLHQHLLC